MTVLTARRLTRDLRSALYLICRQQQAQDQVAWVSLQPAAHTIKRRRYTVDAGGPPSRSFLQSLTPSDWQDPFLDQEPKELTRRSKKREEAPATRPPVNDTLESAPLPFTQRAPHDASLENVDYTTDLRLAMTKPDPYGVVRCLAAARQAQDNAFLAAITDDEFTTILSLVEPQQLLGELVQTQSELRPGHREKLFLPTTYEVVLQYAPLLYALVDMRRRAGARLCLKNYSQLLNACKEVHHRQLAHHFWTMLAEDGYKPDTACYNGFLGSIMWEKPWNSMDKYRELVTDPALLRRQRERLMPRFSNYRIGRGGIHEIVQNVLHEMALEGIEPDTSTHVLHIRAASLEGKPHVVADILKQIWHIDVDSIASNPDRRPRRPPHGHPLCPTKSLLLETLGAFCINNHFDTGLMLAGYMSRHYSLELDEAIWSDLLQFAHIFQGHIRAHKKSMLTGKIKPGTVESLWETMIRPPYNLMPSPGVADKRIRAAFRARRSFSVIPVMEHYRLHFLRVTVPQKHAAWVVLQAVLSSSSASDNDTARSSDGVNPSSQLSLAQALRQYDIALLRFHQEVRFLQNWLFYLLHNTNRDCARAGFGSAEFVQVPRLLDKWRHFAPSVIVYQIPTGTVELDLSAEQRAGDSESYSSAVEQRHAEQLGTRMLMFDGTLPSMELDRQLYDRWVQEAEQDLEMDSDEPFDDGLVDLAEADAESR